MASAPSSAQPPHDASPARKPDNVRGAILLVMATLVLTLEAGIVRWIGPEANASQVVFFRSMAQFIAIAFWIVWKGQWPDLRSPRYMLHLTRGLLSVCTWWLYFRMFQQLDVALATVLTFATSLFVVVLAGPVMGERVRLVSWIATFIGFGGIALASGFGSGTFTPDVAWGLVASAAAAFQVFLNRSLAQTEDTGTIMTFIGFCVVAASIPLAYLHWQPLAALSMAWLMLAGVLGALGMVLSIEAYGVGETSVLAPIPYVRIAFAMIFGFLVFREIPGLTTVAGAAIVIVSAVWAMRHEQRRMQREA